MHFSRNSVDLVHIAYKSLLFRCITWLSFSNYSSDTLCSTGILHSDDNEDLFIFIECPLRETDHPLEILQRWGSGRLILRYTVLGVNGE